MKKQKPTTPPTHSVNCVGGGLAEADETTLDFAMWVPTKAEQRLQDKGIQIRVTIRDKYHTEMIVWGFMPASFVFDKERYKERPEDTQFE